MAEFSKEEKKALMKKWKATQDVGIFRKMILLVSGKEVLVKRVSVKTGE